MPSRYVGGNTRHGRIMHAHESRSRPRSLGVGSGEGVAGWTPITASERGQPRRNGMGVHPSRHRGRPHRRWWVSIVGLGFGRPPKRGVVAHMREVAAPKRETTWTATTHERGLPPVGKMDGQSCLMAVHCGRRWARDVGLSGRPDWTGVVVHYGRGWALIGRPLWAEVGEGCGLIWPSTLDGRGCPLWTGLDAQNGRSMGVHLWARWIATYSRWSPTRSGCGQGWTRVILDAHTSVTHPSTKPGFNSN